MASYGRLALKVFSPAPYPDACGYIEDMACVGTAAAQVARSSTTTSSTSTTSSTTAASASWRWSGSTATICARSSAGHARPDARTAGPRSAGTYISPVILAEGPFQPRFKPGVAIQILRECLAGLGGAASRRHRPWRPQAGQHHGQAHRQRQDHRHRLGHRRGQSVAPAYVVPDYAAPEVLEGGENSPQTDLASLGYVLIEMLAGSPVRRHHGLSKLLDAKLHLDAGSRICCRPK